MWASLDGGGVKVEEVCGLMIRRVRRCLEGGEVTLQRHLKKEDC